MRWLWPRRQPTAWRSQVISRRVHASTDPPPSPLPTPRELVAVIGLGDTVTAADLTITLLSYERYREADIANVRFMTTRMPSQFAYPEPVFRVIAAGDPTPRRTWGMGGSGGGHAGEYSWRHAIAIAPPAADGAAVEVEITKIDWTQHGRGERSVSSTTVGPWRFTVRT